MLNGASMHFVTIAFVWSMLTIEFHIGSTRLILYAIRKKTQIVSPELWGFSKNRLALN